MRHMSLELNIEKLLSPGRSQKAISATVSRELTLPDLERLGEHRHTAAPDIKRISDRHHTLAKLLATGTTEAEAAIITGYSASRISILKSSPAFMELLDLYRKEADRQFTSIFDNMAGLARDAVMELRERLEEDPDTFSHRELLSLSTELSDRAAGQEEGQGRAPMRIELVGRIAGPADEADVPDADS